MYQVKRTNTEIDDQLNKATEAADAGTSVPGMSYEQGVQAGILWVLGEVEDLPIEDE